MRPDTLSSLLVEQMLISLIPESFEISKLATICNAHRTTLWTHLVCNYIEGEDYFKLNPKAKNSKILVARATAIQIRRHYAN